MLTVSERLAQYGSEQLSERELIEILMKNRDIADAIAKTYDSLYGLKKATPHELTQIDGIGPQKANELIAAMELGYRLALSNRPIYGEVHSSYQVGSYFMAELKDEEQEHLIVVCLNVKNKIIAKQTIALGTLDYATMHPRDVFRVAVKHNAARIIMVHNHPSGDPEPSNNDIQTTKRLVKCGELIGIPVLDHIIVGEECYVSLRERGIIEFKP